jgi:hypothetical protein
MRLVEFTTNFVEHPELNPVLWNSGSLRPEVKSALIKIADDFKNFIEVPFSFDDVIITGGQVSYFYTEHSDLDLHLVVDFGKVQCDREAAELFDTKRHLYKRKYNVQIKGIPVEVYVEDKDFPAVSASYSIISDKWLVKPNQNIGEIDHENIGKNVEIWQRLIDSALVSKDVEIAKKTLKLLRNYRKFGLKTGGEYGVANLAYKTLRNNKTLEKLVDFIDQEHDNRLSIK